MGKYTVDGLVKKILELYSIYEGLSKKDGMNIIISETDFIEGPQFRMALVDKNEEREALELNFSHDERSIYEYISLLCFTALVKDELNNSKDDSNVSIIISDEKMLEEIKVIVDLLEINNNEEISNILGEKRFSLGNVDKNMLKDTYCVINYKISSFRLESQRGKLNVRKKD